MNESEFNALAGAAFAEIEAALDACDADLDWSATEGGVLEIEFEDGSKVVVNRHAASQEIWVAARSGGFHFRWDGAEWRDTREGQSLMRTLSQVISGQSGVPVSLA